MGVGVRLEKTPPNFPRVRLERGASEQLAAFAGRRDSVLVLDPGVRREPIDEPMQLLVREVDFLGSTLDVQQAGAH